MPSISGSCVAVAIAPTSVGSSAFVVDILFFLSIPSSLRHQPSGVSTESDGCQRPFCQIPRSQTCEVFVQKFLYERRFSTHLDARSVGVVTDGNGLAQGRAGVSCRTV